MRLIACTIVILYLLKGTWVSAQSGEKLQSIKFEGNTRTKSEYLNKHVHSIIGKPTDTITIKEDLRRIRTLPGVLNASCFLTESDSGLTALFNIEERWTLLPVGDFGISENNYWIGAGAMESNLFGRGIYLYGYIQYKSPFAFHLIIRNPYLFNKKLGVEYEGRIYEVREPVSYFNYDKYQSNENQLFAKYEFVYERDILLGIAYSDEKIEMQDLLLDHKKSIRLMVKSRIQKLDYKYFILDGWKIQILLAYRIPFTAHNNSILLFSECQYYKNFKNRFNLASRIAFGISNEQQTYYLPYVIDSYKNIRGSGYRSFRGNQMGIANIELRTTVFENNYGGIQVVSFSDLGYVGTKKNNSNRPGSDVLTFAGPGIRLIYKKAYNAVLSIDYGFDLMDLQAGGWIIGWGQYF